MTPEPEIAKGFYTASAGCCRRVAVFQGPVTSAFLTFAPQIPTVHKGSMAVLPCKFESNRAVSVGSNTI